MIGAEDDVGADGGSIVMREFLVEGNHAGLFELALQNDFKPLIVVECAGIAEVGEDAAADGDVTMAGEAIMLTEGFALVHSCGSGGGLGRFELRRCERRKRWQAGLTA